MASRRPSLGLLLIAALLAAPVATIGGAVLTVAVAMAAASATYSTDTAAFLFFMFAIVGAFVVCGVLFVVAVPLTLLLDRLGLSPFARNLVLLLLTAAAVWIYTRIYTNSGEVLLLGMTYAGFTAVTWIAAVALVSGRRAANGASK